MGSFDDGPNSGSLPMIAYRHHAIAREAGPWGEYVLDLDSSRTHLLATEVWSYAWVPGTDHLSFYPLTMEGSCWATREGGEPIELTAGDIIVLPQGDTHVLSTEVGMRRTPEMSIYRVPNDGLQPIKISL
ncbi:DUF861 domain-containing protein, partial [Lacticaseibacillus rhamnosus]